MADILKFPSDDVSSEEALEMAKAIDFKEVIVVGFDRDDKLHIYSNKITARDALWLLEIAKRVATGD
jgi:hypothetical protein